MKTAVTFLAVMLAVIGLTTISFKSSAQANETTENIVVAQAGQYFVIMGSFSLSNRNAAQQRLNQVQGCGFQHAYLINTNDYPNLRNGLWAVVLGPVGYAQAQNLVNAARGCIGDSYVKSGW